MEKVVMIEKLVADMRKGIVSFVYRKKNGTERHAIGTLYGVEHTIKGTGKDRKECYWTLKYFDIEAYAWRSFIMENLISVGESRKSTLEEHHQICLALVVRLKDKMKAEGKVAFAYRKTDGTIRYAHGQLTENSGADDRYFTYFDTDKGEERKFRIDSFLGIGEPQEIDIQAITNYFSDNGFKNMSNGNRGLFDNYDFQEQEHTSEYCDTNSETTRSRSCQDNNKRYNDFSEISINSILKEHGISIEDTENIMIVDLLPHLNKQQLKDLIIQATTRLAEL